jgi:hypothetical protein
MTNPASSGGAGTHFEAKVGASYLLSMLLEVDARGLPGCRIESVSLQRSQEGHPLDDIVVRGVHQAGSAATLEIQAKRTLTFTASDTEFREVVKQIGAAASVEGFWGRSHQLGIAVARTTQSMEPSYQDVLSWARHLEGAKVFHERLNRTGTANPAMRNFVSVFRANLEAAGFDHDDEAVWKLLRRVQILVFDFESPAAPTTELMRERAFRALEGGSSAEAAKLWSHLVTMAESLGEVGGNRTRPELSADLHMFRVAGSRTNRRALATLFEETELAITGFDENVGGVSLLRQARVAEVQEAMEASRYVEIRGEAGVGKSGLLRRIADASSVQARPLVLSPNRVVGRGWMAVKALTGYDGDGHDLMNELSLSGIDALFIDNLDFYSPEERVTVGDLVSFAARHPTMRVVVTARPEFGKVEPVWLPKDALIRLGAPVSLTLNELSVEEVEELRSSAPRLASLLSENHPARQIVRNLFRLARLVARGDNEAWPATEAEMARNWWELADGKVDTQLRDRSRLLVKLARHALVSTELFDGSKESAEVIDALKRSGAIREYGRDQLAFGHDVLREWAFANLFFEERGFAAVPDLQARATPDLARGAELVARLALDAPEGVQRWRELVASLDGSHETWRRAVVLALIRSEDATKLLMVAGPLMLADNAALFKELVRYTLAVEFESATRRLQGSSIDVTKISDSWKVPRNSSAAHLVMWSLIMAEQIPASALPEVVKLYAAYTMGTLGGDGLTKLILPALFGWLTTIEADYEADPYESSGRVIADKIEKPLLKIMEEECRTTFLFFCQHTPELAAKYLQSFKGKKNSQELRIEILKLKGSLAQAAPKELVDFALDTFIKQEPRRRRDRYDAVPDRPFEYTDIRFLPASPSQGPFLNLLIHAPEEGLRLVRDMVRYAVRFERGEEPDDRAVVLVRGGKPVTFGWPAFYMWSREYGNAPSLVVSALMALEAWGHRRIEAGDSVEAVVSDIVNEPSCSTAVLLIAVDMLISYWPESADAALPFVGCPELLCMEIGRPGRENVDFPDYFGLKDLQKEPAGPATLESLKQKTSRKASLYNLLPQIAFGPPERRERVQTLLQSASDRLGKPEKHSDLGDPRMMALHALNLLNKENWTEVIGPDGELAGQLQYKAPESEENQMEPIRQQAAPRMEESSLRMAILNELFAKPDTSQEFLSQALKWAKNHQDVFDNRPEYDAGGEFLTMTEAVVSTATLVARSASVELIKEEGSWVRAMFERVYEGPVDPVFLHRDGLRFNPPAIAFAGQVLLLQRSRLPGDEERLLRFSCAAGYGAAHGYGATLRLIQQVDVRLIASLVRCGFEGAVRPDTPWNASEKEKALRNSLLENRISERIKNELDWLNDQSVEPTWPALPIKRAKLRPPLRMPEGTQASEVPEAAEPTLKHVRFDYQRAALWLRHCRTLLDSTPASWLTDMVEAYLPWTQQANGHGGDKKGRFERGPSEWNAVYFEAAARCMRYMEEGAFEQRLRDFFSGLPDEPLMDTVTPFLRSADVGYLDFQTLSIDQLTRIRAFVIEQLQLTRMFSWNKDREETSVTSDIAPAFAALCFNIYNGGFAPTKCFVPPNLIPDTDPFLQLLEDFVVVCRSPFVTLLYLNFFEVAPHEKQISCVLGCSEKWLERFPESNQFWVEWGVGRRISAVLIAILNETPEAFDEERVRPRVDRLLGRLVGLGVNEAHEMERLLYRGGI